MLKSNSKRKRTFCFWRSVQCAVSLLLALCVPFDGRGQDPALLNQPRRVFIFSAVPTNQNVPFQKQLLRGGLPPLYSVSRKIKSTLTKR